ncbi:bifunctional 4-hydroxy-2-oxoglutarate aldolase/2-dehydro-3-deoxy-phosphogluconate aldolase [Ammoniphilus sp. YIM 78166]|uniref:bifunctional 4-hydroxy-2-oxoglutarate aldolase/2-dehydro-3-deoxy-phosphogluconate aldolase n=1 Tax=Ammoniphilus sp. YIM 78166 TaxID=1644106 RepID=UPI001F0DE34E|nr:bifunctional 4-hydroxy-2-oxoglutarate aldolase/2-dehydro-3-deoxy-phosphogluconate aldolase [Ammoniphilus sp. YIM 78166]
MMKLTIPKAEKLRQLVEGGVIAVLRQIPEEKLEALCNSLVEGGVTALEITVDHPKAMTMIEQAAARFEGRALVGAGTVLDSETARLAIQSGAEFVFSPCLKQEMIQTVLRYGKIAAPGVMTPSEMVQAMEWGADVVKVFPATGLGPAFLKDVKGPLSHIPMIPTGGIDIQNVEAFIRAGAAAVGVGGSLIDKEAIALENWEVITEKAKEYARKINQVRKGRD